MTYCEGFPVFVAAAATKACWASLFLLICIMTVWTPDLGGIWLFHTHQTVQNSTLEECAEYHFKDTFQKENHFPKGKWIVLESGNVSKVNEYSSTWFKPQVPCQLSPWKLNKERLKQCLDNQGINYILTMGDSNGKNYFRAVLSIMKTTMESCQLLKTENLTRTERTPDYSYFLRMSRSRDDQGMDESREEGIKYVFSVKKSKCWSCGGMQWRCEYKTPGKIVREIYLEHITLFTMNQGAMNITVHQPGQQQRATQLSYPEFIFKHYLKGGYPQLLLLFPPFNHLGLADYISNLKPKVIDFIRLVHESVPQSTNIYWIPAFSEFESLKPPDRAYKEVFGSLGTAKMKQLNRILFDTLKARLVNSRSNEYSLWDMVQASEDRLPWARNGAHMWPIWYRKVIQSLLTVRCNRKHGL